jgi:4-amino-4-deoxy-L-arabinose transferase-like glycosyltransferase
MGAPLGYHCAVPGESSPPASGLDGVLAREPGMSSSRRDVRLRLAATALVIAASALVLAAYAVRAAALVRYPWDWSPDEGLYLDWARRALQAPSTLYPPSTVVPFPAAYGPVLPFLLAPVIALGGPPLAGARLLALAWTGVGALCVYVLARKASTPILALAGAALALAPFDLTFWHMLVRVDGPMITLLLAAAIPLLPRSLARGGDLLSTGRLLTGSVLLLAAILTKATAALTAAPLVLGWFVVDRRGAVRLCLALTLSGLLALGGLEWATSGGFFFASSLWRVHTAQPGQSGVLVLLFLRRAWPVLLLCLLGLWAARGRRAEALRDPTLLLLLGCVLVVPTMSKFGAWWNYLLPALPVLAVLAARWWGRATATAALGGISSPTLGAVGMAAVALALASTRVFPLPTPDDERTSRAFYSYVTAHVARAGRPILASRPELAYFLVDQPCEIEGSGYPLLAAASVPGTETVLHRLEHAEYTLLIEAWPFPSEGVYTRSIARSYVDAGGCRVGYFFGTIRILLLPRRDVAHPMRPQPGTRCGSAVSGGALAPNRTTGAR